MKMKRFKIQNYKCIEATDWVELDDLLCLVGKNESGKTSILQALYKFNPATKNDYIGLYEFPRARYAEEFKTKNWEVVAIDFELDDKLKAKLVELNKIFEHLNNVIIHKDYSSNFSIEYPNIDQEEIAKRSLNVKDLEAFLKLCTTDIPKLTSSEKGEDLARLIKAILQNLSQFESQIKSLATTTDNPIMEIFKKIYTYLTGIISQDWQKGLFSNLLKNLEEKNNKKDFSEQIEKAKKELLENLPVFIYFDSFNIIDNAIDLEEFRSKVQHQPLEPKIRATRALFDYCKYDYNRITSIGQDFHGNPSQSRPAKEIIPEKDERTILSQSASINLTKKFREMWSQREHTFDIKTDGKICRIWVKDDKNPADIPLEDRSKGLQWFFSFTVIFEVESERGHKNAILLLDEPGLNLHPKAQTDFVKKTLRRLSRKNQVIYTTHSPFMIDDDFFEGVRVLEESEEGKTIVSPHFTNRDPDSIFPIQAALGYTLSQTLFQGKKTLIVEGITDYYYLRAFSILLEKSGKTGLMPDIVIAPAGGTSQMLTMTSIMIAQGVELGVLMDSDKTARGKKNQLEDTLIPSSKKRIVMIGDIIARPNAEIEDIVPRDLFLDAVKVEYKVKNFTFTGEEDKLPIVDALQSFFKRTKPKEKFEKWRVAERLVENWRDVDPTKLSSDLLENCEKLISVINALF